MTIAAGRVLSGRYRLIRPIGVGSQAAVWIAEHLALSTQVAVKLIDSSLARKDDMRERFRREATAAAQLRSAHVVQILDHGIDGDQPFIVMELLEGEDLYDRLRHRGRLTLYETSKIITQVARALTRAHAASIVHRDLKPENVFVVQNDDDEVVKVLDFGIAKVQSPDPGGSKRTELGELLGTPHYMSPEQIKGLAEIDHRTDLWALGVIAYQCATGQLPFDSQGMGDLLIKIAVADPPVPSQVTPGLTPAFDGWFERACAREPKDRFQSAREMADALARAVGIAPELLRGPPSAPRSERDADAPGAAAAKARPASPIVIVTELPPDSRRPPKSAKSAAEPAPSTAATLAGEERTSTVPPVPLLRKRTEHGPARDAKAHGPKSGARGEPDEAGPREGARDAADDDAPAKDARHAGPSQERAERPAPSARGEDAPPTERAGSPERDEASGSSTRGAATEATSRRARASAEARPPSDRAPAPLAASTPAVRSRAGTTADLSSPATEPPPELDGSRRQRAGRLVGLGVLAGAIALAGVVVRSQLGAGVPALAGAAATPTAAPPTASPTAPASGAPTASASAAAPASASAAVEPPPEGVKAIDPGARPERDAGRLPGPMPSSTSSGKPWGARPAAKMRAGGDDVVIEVPDAVEDPAPRRTPAPLE
jgi:serine/threonine-protein kinase